MNSLDYSTHEPMCYNCKHFDSINNKCNSHNRRTYDDYYCSIFESADLTFRSIDEYRKHRREPTLDFRPLDFNINNYKRNVELVLSVQPMFYDRNGIFWYWNKNLCCWNIINEIELLNIIEKCLSLNGQTVTNNMKCSYIEAFKRVGITRIPKIAPKYWIQFKDKVFDIKTKEVLLATPEYFLCNPISWKLGITDHTPVLDKLFTEWVGKDHMQTLYEMIAYCTLADMPIHVAFCLIGNGMNGKSVYQSIVAKYVGMNNICSTELDVLVDSRFEATKLYKKLVCQLGETNFGNMQKTSLFKKLTGGDLIGYEFKNKQPFDDYNYAKIIINSNSLPTTDDNSDGYMRRWFIIDFPNDFRDKEGTDIMSIIDDTEFENLSKKITNILPDLLSKARFTGQGNIEERRNKYIMASNPLPLFVKIFCKFGSDEFVLTSDFYKEYIKFLKQTKRRQISKRELLKLLGYEGYESKRLVRGMTDIQDYYIDNVSIDTLKLNEFYKKCSECSECSVFILSSLYKELI